METRIGVACVLTQEVFDHVFGHQMHDSKQLLRRNVSKDAGHEPQEEWTCIHIPQRGRFYDFSIDEE